MAAAGGAGPVDILETGTADQVQQELVRILEVNPDVNQVFEGGTTILHRLAANPNALEVLEMFLKNPGVNVNLQDANGETAATYALERGSVQAGLLLLKDPRTNIAVKKTTERREIWGETRRTVYSLFALVSQKISRLAGSISSDELLSLRMMIFDIFSKHGWTLNSEMVRPYRRSRELSHLILQIYPAIENDYAIYVKSLKQRGKNLLSLQTLKKNNNSSAAQVLSRPGVRNTIGSFLSGESGSVNTQLRSLHTAVLKGDTRKILEKLNEAAFARILQGVKVRNREINIQKTIESLKEKYGKNISRLKGDFLVDKYDLEIMDKELIEKKKTMIALIREAHLAGTSPEQIWAILQNLKDPLIPGTFQKWKENMGNLALSAEVNYALGFHAVPAFPSDTPVRLEARKFLSEKGRTWARLKKEASIKAWIASFTKDPKHLQEARSAMAEFEEFNATTVPAKKESEDGGGAAAGGSPSNSAAAGGAAAGGASGGGRKKRKTRKRKTRRRAH